MFVGTKSSQSRIDNYKSKIRAYSGTGSQPDYTAPVLQFKLHEIYKRITQAFGVQSSYQNAAPVLLGSTGTGVGVRVPVVDGDRF